MKSLLTAFVFCFSAFCARSQAILNFDRLFLNAGTVAQNSEGTVKLTFTNTGNKPLTITGCTVTAGEGSCTFDKKSIAAEKTGFITYKYDTKTCGRWNASVTVKSTGGETVIHLKGVVECDAPIEQQIPKQSGPSE